MIDQAFKSAYLNANMPNPFNSGLRIDLMASVTVTMVFVQNHSLREAYSKLLGNTAVYITDNFLAT